MASIFEISKGAVRAKEYPGCTSQFFILQKYEKYIQTRLAVDPDKPPALENYRGAGRRGINFYTLRSSMSKCNEPSPTFLLLFLFIFY